MKFWAIAYQFQEDVFYDFEKREDTLTFKESCFLPTEDMAKKFIEEELSEVDYVPVKITIESLSKEGTMVWTRDEVKRWDKWEEEV